MVAAFPPELLYRICASVYYAAQHTSPTSLDPIAFSDIAKPPTGSPSSHPPPIWSEPVARKTLHALCLVNKPFCHAAKPWLWLQVQVRLPRSWLAFVDALTDMPDAADPAIATEGVVNTVLHRVASGSSELTAELQAASLRQSVFASLTCDPPDGSIPPELLSPPASREPSPRRLQDRATSPGRWRLMRAISDAVEEVVKQKSPDVYGASVPEMSNRTSINHGIVPAPDDPHPGRHIQHLDFNHFRTIGMRRSVEEGVSNRFVTAERVYRILQEMPNLIAFGATEYMDGALNLRVLCELLFRGQTAQVARRVRNKTKTTSVDEEDDDDWARRGECLPLQAIDFCGCVSAVFIDGLTQLVDSYLRNDSERQESRRGRRSSIPAEYVSCPGVLRLGLRGAKSIAAPVLEPLVLAFPSLTHLDLSGTRATPGLLYALGASRTVRLEALSLGRCPSLTGEALEWLFISGRPTYSLAHLNLYGDNTFPSPLSEQQLERIVTQAPCFTSQKLKYLDLSANPVTAQVLGKVVAQPALRSLGLSYIPGLSLKTISSFVLRACKALEIVTLINTSPELLGPPRFVAIALHQDIIAALAKPPFSFSLTPNPVVQPPPTNLRVIELSSSALTGLGDGSEGWRIVRGKGGRGWYVDTASGWCAEGVSGAILRRDLSRSHPLRQDFNQLADACGNVSSGVGWHARKMEILHGQGMLGREEGLYGAVSFAYSS